MRMLSRFIGIFALLAVCSLSAAEKSMPLGRAMKAASGPDIETKAARAESLVRSGDAIGLAEHLADLKADPSLSPAARERLIYDSLKAAARLPSDPRLLREVEALTSYRTETLVWSDEHGHREYRPLFDVASAARQTRNLWVENAFRGKASASIRAADDEIVREYIGLTGHERAGVNAAFREAKPELLLAYRPVLLEAMKAGEPVGEIALTVAQTTHDAGLMEEVISSASASVALRAVSGLDMTHWSGQTLPLLTVAMKRPDIQSAAVLAAGRIAAAEPAATDMLFDLLGSRSGASAAAALARTDRGEVIARLAEILGSAGDETRRRHALLALRLSALPSAAQALSAFAADPAAPSSLVSEVPSWASE